MHPVCISSINTGHSQTNEACVDNIGYLANDAENLGSLSNMLFESLPSQQDIERIYAAVSEHHVMPHEVMTMPYAILKRDKQTL